MSTKIAINKGITTTNNNKLKGIFTCKSSFIVDYSLLALLFSPKILYIFFFHAYILNNIVLNCKLVKLRKDQFHQANWDEVYRDKVKLVIITMFVAVDITIFENEAAKTI